MKFQRLFFSIAACAVMLLGFSTTASANITAAGCIITGTTAGQSAPTTYTSLANFASQCQTANGGVAAPSLTISAPSDNININSGGSGPATVNQILAGSNVSCSGANCGSTGTAGTAGTASGAVSTWFIFQYTLGQNVNQSLTITHDDGIALFVGNGTTGTLETPAAAAGPTGAVGTTFTMTGTAGQTVDLLYDECCGLAAVLQANLPGEVIPEPSSIVLLGSVLVFGSAAVRRRRLKKG